MNHQELISDLSGGCDGILLIHAPHTTAGLILNENERGLKIDILNTINSFFEGSYEHDSIDDNGAAHLANCFLGQTITLPVKAGSLVRGQWQNILFVELDGPRNERRLILEFIRSI